MSLQSEIEAVTQSKGKLTASIAELEQALTGLGAQAIAVTQELEQAFGQGLAETGLFAAGTTEFGLPPFVLSAELEEKVEALLERIREIDGSVDDIPDKLDALTQAIDDAETRLDEGHASLNDELDDRLEQFSTALEAQGEALTDGFETMRDDVEARFKEVGDSVESFLEDALQAKPQEALEDATKLFNAALESSTELVETISQELVASLAGSLDELTEFIADSAETAIETVADRLIELLTDRVSTEAVNAVLEVQLGAQLTMMLQPYLPQLMVASAVAPAVQSALDVMRAGF